MSFELIRSQKNKFLEGTLYQYTHTRTKCEILHIHNTDPENIFLFAVPTYSTDDKGVAHILEHSVLSGSQCFDVKSPFFRLDQGSCRTYLNAATYPDRTIYPGASLLKQDLFNIMSMSGDAVWFPLLKEEVFYQEGFHLIKGEHDEFNAAGVVYNEMKGVYSDKFTLVENEINSKLFADSPYKYDSGGCPQSIPYISYKEFLGFHKKFYRPEHTKIILYGNIKTQEYLDFIDETLLSRWQEEVHSPIPLQPLQNKKNLFEAKIKTTLSLGFKVKKEFNKKYFTQHISILSVPFSDHPAGEEGSVDITWLIGDTNNMIETSILRFIQFVLIGIPGAPLRKAMVESGLIEDLSPLSGASTYLQQSTFTVGGVGMKESNYKALCELVFVELARIVEQGLDEALKNAAMSRIEFSFKERLNNVSRKVSWISSLASKWLYNQDPFVYTDMHLMLDKIKKELEKPHVLEEYIRRHLLENSHKVIVGVHADKNYNNRDAQEEKKLLADLYAEPEQKFFWEDVYTKINKYHKTQDIVENIDTVPQLHRSDLPRNVEKIDFFETKLDNNEAVVQWIPHLDNGVMYMSIHFDITDIVCDVENRFLFPTFSAALTEIGVKTIHYDKMSIQICLSTGRMGAVASNYIHVDSSSRVFLNIGMSVLGHKLVEGFDLLKKILLEVDFANTIRLREIVMEGKAMMRSRIHDDGTAFAIMKGARNYSFNAVIDDDWNGISQLEWLLSLGDAPNIAHKLEELRARIFTQDRMSCTVVGAGRMYDEIERQLIALEANLPKNSLKDLVVDKDLGAMVKDRWGYKFFANMSEKKVRSHAVVLPNKVSYNAQIFKSVGYVDPTFAHHYLASRLISEKLLEKIRMEYGAYGAHASVLGDEAMMICYTYRDPNISESFVAFKQAIEEVASGNFDHNTLNTHIVGAVGESLVQNSPTTKSKAVFTRRISGITDSVRQNVRNTLLGTIKYDVCKAATELLANEDFSCKVSVSSEEKIMQSKESMAWEKIEYASH